MQKDITLYPISAKYYQYLLWYDNKYVGLEALKKTVENKFQFSVN